MQVNNKATALFHCLCLLIYNNSNTGTKLQAQPATQPVWPSAAVAANHAGVVYTRLGLGCISY